MSNPQLMAASRAASPLYRIARVAFLACALLISWTGVAQGQVRERPIAFDSAGRIMAITPPLAARLGLASPEWPVTGDFLEARLYALDDPSGGAVLVVRRQREVLERFALAAAQRRELERAVASGMGRASEGGRDAQLAVVSEPVQGAYVINQSLLGGLLFGPAAAAVVHEPAAGTAAYLLVAGGTFFLAVERLKSHSVSRAQNHLSWHLARQGASAADLVTYALVGERADGPGFAGAILLGGIVGDIVGDRIGKSLTDAEVHGLSHGAVFTSALAGGVLGSLGLSDGQGNRRTASLALLGAQAIGYPVGLRYVRGTRYRVTAGDVGTLLVGEGIGMGAAATAFARDGVSGELASAMVTSGFALGAIAADRAIALRYDYTETESRLLQLGSAAGAVIGLAIPVLASSEDAPAYFGAATAGGLIGAIVTHRMLAPARAGEAASTRRTGSRVRPLDVSFTPQNLLMVGMRTRGVYPLLNVGF